MQRVTVVLDDELLEEIDRLTVERGYANRSEAVRDLTRSGIRQAAEDVGGSGDCVAALAYAYDFTQRGLGRRLGCLLGDNHDLVVSGQQVHLDHTNRLEISILRGASDAVRRLGEQVIAERGVRHGRLIMMPVELTHERHDHGGDAPHDHLHVRVRDAG
jgi:CopG family transcriptional regulator, nickel-responsive regulator